MSNTATKPGRVPTIEENVAATRPDDVCRLLSEYTRKFRRLTARSKAVADAQSNLRDRLNRHKSVEYRATVATASELSAWFKKLMPVALDLVRYASGLIEAVRLERVTILELRLRNAEMEAAVEIAAAVLDGLDRSS